MSTNTNEDPAAMDAKSPEKPSIRITKRTDRSTFMMILHTVMRPFRSYILKLGDPLPAGSPQITVHKKAVKKISASERRVEDIYVYDLSPISKRKASENKAPRKRIYYFAGGGWQMPASSEHWSLLAELATKVPDMSISLVSYPLAPNSPAPTAIPQLLRFYRKIMQEAHESGEEVILAGDSAGGNIILCIVISALQQEENETEKEKELPNPSSSSYPAPKALLAICPSTDLQRSNPQIAALQPKDPLLNLAFVQATATAWCGSFDASDVRVSPLHADLAPLARRGIQVHGVTGGYDILSCDAVLFRDKCARAGVQGEWLEWDRQMHCFPLAFAFGLRESVEAKEWILEVLRRS